MWRRAPARQLHSHASLWRSALGFGESGHIRKGGGDPFAENLRNRGIASVSSSSSSQPSPFQKTAPLLSGADAGLARTVGKKRVADVMPIATGLEREELVAELEGRKRFDMDAPIGPFGTKEAPAVIMSYYDKRIVGCPGGESEDEHDVVWFWLEKGKPHECSLCSQYFELEVIGPGGPPDGHGDD